jgi:anaerobic magnesium-protoporphyrin IX monomethyl ester cyclase
MLKKAGCQVVWVGAESGSQKILDAMEKGTRVEQIREASRRLHAAGIQIAFFLQFGYPGETREDIEKTFQVVRECQPDEIGMSVSYPLPGTKFYEAIRQQLGSKQNWQDSSDMAMLYRGPYSTAFYRRLHVVLHREYRARKYGRELRSLLSRPGRPQLKHLKHAIAMVYYTLALPLERLRLRHLETAPHQGVSPLVPQLTHEQAATPSAQNES